MSEKLKNLLDGSTPKEFWADLPTQDEEFLEDISSLPEKQKNGIIAYVKNKIDAVKQENNETLENKKCRCKEPRIREVAYCEECLGGFPSTSSMRGKDSCTSTHGITDYDIVDDRKIYRCDHYVYCPLCGWRCESEEDLEKHLDATGYDDKRICDGSWRYGAYGVNQVKNELKYWRLCKRQERVISELKLALSCLENQWELLVFEIPLRNSIRWLEGGE